MAAATAQFLHSVAVHAPTLHNLQRRSPRGPSPRLRVFPNWYTHCKRSAVAPAAAQWPIPTQPDTRRLRMSRPRCTPLFAAALLTAVALAAQAQTNIEKLKQMKVA